MEIAGREVRTVRRTVQYILLEFFQRHSGDMCRMGPRVGMEQAHAAWWHSPSFVLNGSSKPCQGVTICSGINCCTRRQEIDQENAFSVLENGRHEFFTEIEVLNFLVLGECVWCHCSDCCLNSGMWWKHHVSSSVTMESRNSSPFWCAVREKLQRGTHPFRFVIVR